MAERKVFVMAAWSSRAVGEVKTKTYESGEVTIFMETLALVAGVCCRSRERRHQLWACNGQGTGSRSTGNVGDGNGDGGRSVWRSRRRPQDGSVVL